MYHQMVSDGTPELTITQANSGSQATIYQARPHPTIETRPLHDHTSTFAMIQERIYPRISCRQLLLDGEESRAQRCVVGVGYPGPGRSILAMYFIWQLGKPTPTQATPTQVSFRGAIARMRRGERSPGDTGRTHATQRNFSLGRTYVCHAALLSRRTEAWSTDTYAERSGNNSGVRTSACRLVRRHLDPALGLQDEMQSV
ncbi:hypothetical protein B0H12DRAFT_686029 [Mycena haematopus]|nr:hypothetical protein B0H12DRAFT_686029 [Mycena haematopus]